MTGQMLSTKCLTPYHGRVHRVQLSICGGTRSFAHWLNFHHRLGTTRTVGFGVLFSWPVWFGGRLLDLFRMVPPHVRSLVGNPSSSHVAKSPFIHSNPCSHRRCSLFLVIYSGHYRISSRTPFSCLATLRSVDSSCISICVAGV